MCVSISMVYRDNARVSHRLRASSRNSCGVAGCGIVLASLVPAAGASVVAGSAFGGSSASPQAPRTSAAITTLTTSRIRFAEDTGSAHEVQPLRTKRELMRTCVRPRAALGAHARSRSVRGTYPLFEGGSFLRARRRTIFAGRQSAGRQVSYATGECETAVRPLLSRQGWFPAMPLRACTFRMLEAVGVQAEAVALGFQLEMRVEPTGYVAVASRCSRDGTLRASSEVARGSDPAVVALAALAALRELARRGKLWPQAARNRPIRDRLRPDPRRCGSPRPELLPRCRDHRRLG
jgi:hypothetical protein